MINKYSKLHLFLTKYQLFTMRMTMPALILTLHEEHLILVEINEVMGWNSMVNIASLHGLDGPGLNPGRDKIFHTCPEEPWGPTSLLYNGYQFSFPEVKRLECGTGYPPPSSAQVEERVIPPLPSRSS
jgi:hypothetical protein